MTNPRFIVMISAAHMPASCWGVYKRVAVVELDGTVEYTKMISNRARGIKRVVETWERLRYGTSSRSVYVKALKEANDLANKLNNVSSYI